VANQGAIIKSLETQIGQLSKLVTTYVSIDIARNTVDNPKEECKTLTEKELKHERDWEELMEFKRWFAALGMTLEEAYDMFIDELEEFHLGQTAGPTMPHKKTDPGSVTIIYQIEEETVSALCDIGSSVNALPLSLARKLKLKEPTV
jgi:hypothetical protein